MPHDVVKRAEDHSYVPTPVTSGARWRLLGGVVFTVIDLGAGLIDMVVTNSLPQAVNAFLTWSWGGVTGQSTEVVAAGRGTTLTVQLPPGYDATLEISATK
jgi:hypothetical protein